MLLLRGICLFILCISIIAPNILLLDCFIRSRGLRIYPSYWLLAVMSLVDLFAGMTHLPMMAATFLDLMPEDTKTLHVTYTGSPCSSFVTSAYFC